MAKLWILTLLNVIKVNAKIKLRWKILKSLTISRIQLLVCNEDTNIKCWNFWMNEQQLKYLSVYYMLGNA